MFHQAYVLMGFRLGRGECHGRPMFDMRVGMADGANHLQWGPFFMGVARSRVDGMFVPRSSMGTVSWDVAIQDTWNVLYAGSVGMSSWDVASFKYAWNVQQSRPLMGTFLQGWRFTYMNNVSPSTCF